MFLKSNVKNKYGFQNANMWENYLKRHNEVVRCLYLLRVNVWI